MGFLLNCIKARATELMRKHRNRQCELDPENTDCLIRTAIEQIKSGNYSAARDTFTKARKAEPRDADVLVQEGIAWQQAGVNKEAEAAYVAAFGLIQTLLPPTAILASCSSTLAGFKKP